jgi:hypothetical protein
MPTIKKVSTKSTRNILKAWSWVLLILLGLLSTFTGCETPIGGIEMYGVYPPENFNKTINPPGN